LRLRPGALLLTWLVASLAAGIASTLLGFVENLRGDGSILGVLDATGGRLLGTLAPAFFFIAFFFLPIVTLFEWWNVRTALPYVIGGGFGGTLAMAVFVWPAVYSDWVWLLVVPGFLAGATWWLLVVRPATKDSQRAAHD
jgi:hypothetical protein